MLRPIERKLSSSSLEVTDYYVTLFGETQENYIFDIAFSILQSELYEKNIRNLKLKIYKKIVWLVIK